MSMILPPGLLSPVLAAAVLAAALAGCQGIGGLLGGGGGVMPDNQIGLPPSLRGTVKGAANTASGAVDDDGRPVSGGSGRALTLPKTVRGDARTAQAGERRISREEIEDGQSGSGGGSSAVGPQMGANGRMGLGGRF